MIRLVGPDAQHALLRAGRRGQVGQRAAQVDPRSRPLRPIVRRSKSGLRRMVTWPLDSAASLDGHQRHVELQRRRVATLPLAPEEQRDLLLVLGRLQQADLDRLLRRPSCGSPSRGRCRRHLFHQVVLGHADGECSRWRGGTPAPSRHATRRPSSSTSPQRRTAPSGRDPPGPRPPWAATQGQLAAAAQRGLDRLVGLLGLAAAAIGGWPRRTSVWAFGTRSRALARARWATGPRPPASRLAGRAAPRLPLQLVPPLAGNVQDQERDGGCRAAPLPERFRPSLPSPSDPSPVPTLRDAQPGRLAVQFGPGQHAAAEPQRIDT